MLKSIRGLNGLQSKVFYEKNGQKLDNYCSVA